jgi:diadenosine tetraphosphatase ApaH/serine/threonine PP2A family protein phosphatase
MAQRQTLHALPPTLDISDEVLAVHGTPFSDTTYLLEQPVEGRLAPAPRALVADRLGEAARRAVVLCGHSHRQAVVQGPGGCLILNPGSVGCPVFADVPTAPLAEHRSPHARYAVLTKRNGRWGAELIALDYDWDQAAARAATLGWPKWAEALATGAVS